MPTDWKRKYFTKNPDGTYTVVPSVRDNVIFQTFNLMNPINFRRKFDVIFCRNVMIYFDQPTKDALVGRFCRCNGSWRLSADQLFRKPEPKLSLSQIDHSDIPEITEGGPTSRL